MFVKKPENILEKFSLEGKTALKIIFVIDHACDEFSRGGRVSGCRAGKSNSSIDPIECGSFTFTPQISKFIVRAVNGRSLNIGVGIIKKILKGL